jgi:hypothetical protein
MKKKNILLLVPIKKAGPTLFRQAQDIAKISTCFGFAQTEKYKIREILLPVLRAKESTLSRITTELHLYTEWGKGVKEAAPGYYAEQISLHFNREIIQVLKKFMEKNYNTENNIKETES